MTDKLDTKLRPEYQNYPRQKCFVAYTEQSTWKQDLLAGCEAVFNQPEYDLEVDYARRHFAVDIPLRQKALDLIANSRYGIYDISYWQQHLQSPWQMPRNVFIELGIAIALNRPLLLLRHSSNRSLEIPKCLQCVSDRVLEFSGTKSLERILTTHLPELIAVTPQTAWFNRHCIFGQKACEHREVYPKAKQLEQQKFCCAIADGTDANRDDFRATVEDFLNRYNDLTYTYLDSLSMQSGYNFLLCTHCQIARSSPITIYRITSETPPEAFISIGISLALEEQFTYKIPKILIAERIDDIPSLLKGYEVMVVNSDTELKQRLKEFMPPVLTKIRETSWKPRPLPFIVGWSDRSDEVELLEILENEPDLDLIAAGLIPEEISDTDLDEAIDVEESGYFSTLRTKITDLEILKSTLRDLGITVKTETDVRLGGRQRVRADVVAVLEGEYDLGFSRNPDGSFDLIADLWGVAKKHAQTELINSINQQYAVNKTLSEVRQRTGSIDGITKQCPNCDSSWTEKDGELGYKCKSCGWFF
jgi:hypothetical protein